MLEPINSSEALAKIKSEFTPWTLPREHWYFFGLERIDLDSVEVQTALREAAQLEVDPDLLRQTLAPFEEKPPTNAIHWTID